MRFSYSTRHKTVDAGTSRVLGGKDVLRAHGSNPATNNRSPMNKRPLLSSNKAGCNGEHHSAHFSKQRPDLSHMPLCHGPTGLSQPYQLLTPAMCLIPPSKTEDCPSKFHDDSRHEEGMRAKASDTIGMKTAQSESGLLKTSDPAYCNSSSRACCCSANLQSPLCNTYELLDQQQDEDCGSIAKLDNWRVVQTIQM